MSEKGCCEEEKEHLNAELHKLVLESNGLKENYKNLLILNIQKDVEIRDLKKKREKNKFTQFKGILSQLCLDKLEIFGNSVEQDSSFVCCVVNDLFDISTLKNLTLSGRSKSGEKSEIAKEKKGNLEAIFKQRLAHVPRQEFNEAREKSLNKHIRNAIDSAIKKNTDSANP